MKRQNIPQCLMLVLLSIALMGKASAAGSEWPLWNSYWSYFGSPDGRIRDPDTGNRTTSEAQAYGMFFALVANDRERFARLLQWTEQNLAGGDLRHHLPAWTWGLRADGKWGVLDPNSASDADLWLAYSLIQAGKLWNEPHYLSLGQALAEIIVRQEMVQLPGFGLMLLPGGSGFRNESGYELNPSYLPVQVLLGLAQDMPGGPWSKIAHNVARLIAASSPKGFVMDWVLYDPAKGFTPSKGPRDLPMGAWDAIRVYLWAGMLDQSTPARNRILQTIAGIDNYLRVVSLPPLKVNPQGHVTDGNGSVGFSAALVPYLLARGAKTKAAIQRKRVEAALDSTTGLYGKPPRYYDQNLALFAIGWFEQRFRFDSTGVLNVPWAADSQ
jgi:endoglucanase